MEKGRQKVYCDMEIDHGGWTLFLNYIHFPGSELLLNENKFPTNLKSNSHMYLKNAGFGENDVKEVRFLCSEKHKAGNKYWHFKTYSDGILKTALTGDQTYMKVNSSLNRKLTLFPAISKFRNHLSLKINMQKLLKNLILIRSIITE